MEELIKENYYKNVDYLVKKNSKWKEFFDSLTFPPENIIFFKTEKNEISSKLKINEKDYLLISSSYSPSIESEIVLNGIDGKHNFLIIGIGTGNILNSIINKFPESEVIAIEPKKEIFQTFLSLNKLDERYDKVKFIISENIIPIYEFFRNSLYSGRQIKIYINPNLFFNFEIYNKIFKNINDTFNGIRLNLSTMVSFRNYHFGNTILNLKYWLNSGKVKSFKDKFKGITGLAVASGPSLDKTIEYIKDFKNRSLIICAPTSLKPLINKGIRPDIVASVDPQPITIEQFKDVDIDGIYLLANEHTYPEVVELFKDRVIFFEMTSSYKDIEKKGVIYVSGTVATCLLSFLLYCGCNPIVLMGFDFSFDGKKHHVSNSFYEKINSRMKIIEEKYDELNLIEVEGNFKEKVKTDKVYYWYLKVVSNYIKENNGKAKFINCTYGGAKIENTELLEPEFVIKNYLKDEIDIERKIKRIFRTSKGYNKNRIIKKIKKLEKKIKNIEELSLKGIQFCNSALIEFKIGKGEEILKEMDKLNKKIFKYEKEIESLMSPKILIPYIMGEFWKLADEKNKEDWIRFQKEVYSGIYVGCEELKNVLKEVKDEYIY
jgi:hypothetical protein